MRNYNNGQCGFSSLRFKPLTLMLALFCARTHRIYCIAVVVEYTGCRRSWTTAEKLFIGGVSGSVLTVEDDERLLVWTLVNAE
ncbi:unnamed protein product [Linum trigynum]|uniref:Secreted protein n=1 Tax=Linum trigynum TaxID=586398 RepID=A0AAV2CCZ0_9ROSI